MVGNVSCRQIHTSMIESSTSMLCLVGSGVECKRLSELYKTKGQECVVMGTVFQQMDLKPSILKEISSKVRISN